MEKRRKKKYKVNYAKFVPAILIIISVLVAVGVLVTRLSDRDNKQVDVYSSNSDNTSKVEETPKEPEEYKLKISAGGDLLIHDTVFKSVQTSDGYNFDPIFSDIKYIFEESDLSLINLEVPVAGNIFKPSNYPNFNSPVELLDAVKNMNIDVVSTANNHALDKGIKGLNETIKNAESKDLKVVGTYLTDDTKPLIIEKNNIKIGIAAYTYGTNGIAIPKDAPYCINIIDKEKMKSDIDYMNSEGVDFKIFCMHFGQEYQTTQNKSQEDLANFLVDNGVDIVFGSHPHVPQPYEIKTVKNSDGTEKQAFVIYSLGNFVSHQSDYYTKLGAVASVNVSKKGDKKKIDSYKVTPIYTYIKTSGGKKNFKVVPLEKAIYEYDNGVKTYSEKEYTSFKKMLSDTNYIYEKLTK